MIIFAHGDCDGICSAAILLHKFRDAKLFFTSPAGLLNDLKSISNEDLIIVDIAITSRFKDEICGELKRISTNNMVMYFDHHPLPPGLNEMNIPVNVVFRDEYACASELVFRYFIGDIHHDMGRVMLYGCIGDYRDDTEFSKTVLNCWDKRELYLDAGILIEGIEGAGKRNYDFKRAIASKLSNNIKPSLNDELVKYALNEASRSDEMRLYVKRNVKVHGCVSYILDVAWSLGKSAIYARVYGETIIGVAGESRGEYIDMSIRSIGLKNLNEIVSMVAENLGGVGGGHRDAAGARVEKSKFMDFIHGINEKVKASMNIQPKNP
ncbi:MAG: DHHA1 domain-containing protein [Candidatus Verstraetearchaeota archaeon]|jgi:RecJ-like exonuclease|nr:DHHA1 domain-containing protein [Candidatus Verstraetearchaeota archaeon]